MTAEPAPGSSGRSSSLSRPAQRLYGVDLLRAICALLVVLLHAAIPYMSDPLPELIWSINPVEKSSAANIIGWVIDGFIMPIFFLMNGYFSAQLIHQRGSKAFRSHRLRRIGGPFLFGCLVILPMDLAIWLSGWLSSEIVTLQQVKTLKMDRVLETSLHGVSHLWFLQYVLVYCLAASWLRDWFVRSVSQPPIASGATTPAEGSSQFPSLSSRWGKSLLSLFTLTACILVAAAILWWQPRIVIGFRHSFWPLWENLIYYSVPFALGWYWERHSPGRSTSQAQWLVQLGLSVFVFGWLWPELRAHLNAETIPVSNWRVPFLFATFAILVSSGLFGYFLTAPITRIPEWAQYLSKASFWIYLFHHPAVALAQVLMLHASLPATIKFGISFLFSIGMCLLTYETLVRRTWVGELLNGTRDPSPVVSSSSRSRLVAQVK